jgi:protein-glutamine gamma-glutamyltransferase
MEKDILNKLSQSRDIYRYSSIMQLKFEMELRVNIIKAAKELDKSKFEFEVFKKAYCNTDFWFLTKNGGFKLKEGIKPSDAVKDIYINSSKYATECATAIIIVYYKALVDLYPEELFNDMFPGIFLMDWSYLDEDLDIDSSVDINDFIPGDCLYFVNPEVDPETTEWQGENVIDLSNGNYYGHGIGVGTAEKMIKKLNGHRKKDAKESAFLTNLVTRPNLNYLASRYLGYTANRKRAGYYRELECCETNICPFSQMCRSYYL